MLGSRIEKLRWKIPQDTYCKQVSKSNGLRFGAAKGALGVHLFGDQPSEEPMMVVVVAPVECFGSEITTRNTLCPRTPSRQVAASLAGGKFLDN
jgi:hypothetical protein